MSEIKFLNEDGSINFRALKVEEPAVARYIDPMEIRRNFNILCEILQMIENGGGNE